MGNPPEASTLPPPTPHPIKLPAALYTVQETAYYLRCSTRTVWRLLSMAALTRVSLGRAVRITRASIERFIEAGGAA